MDTLNSQTLKTLNSLALKRIMIEKGIGVSKLAAKINTQPHVVGGRFLKNNPKVQRATVKKLSTALNVDPFTLIYGGVDNG